MKTAEKMQAALRASIAAGAHRVGPFLVTIDADSTGVFRNYAIPDDGAAPSTGDIAELLAFFAAHDRLPRLEFVGPAPDVEQPLANADFGIDNRLALLVLPDSIRLAAAPLPAGVTLSEPTSDVQLRTLAAMQNAAYGEAGVSAADVSRLRSTLDAGGAVVTGWQDGTVVAGGALAAPRDGQGEIYGVATAAGHRRRGLGSAIAAALTHIALERGIVPYLQTEGAAEQRMYERLGYRKLGELVDARGPVTTDHRVPVLAAAEAPTQLAFLNYLRVCLATKLVGLGEQDARRPVVASGTNLLWLVKHTVGVETFWLHCVFAGDPEDVIPDDEDL